MSEQNALTLLTSFIAEGDEAQRCYSIQAIKKMPINEEQLISVITPIQDNLYHQDPDVVIDAAEALAVLGENDSNAESVKLLIDVAKHHPDGDARISATKALILLKTKEVDLLMLEFAKGRPSDEDWSLVSGWDDWWDIQLLAINYIGQNQIIDGLQVINDLLLDPENIELESSLLNSLALHSEESLQQLYIFSQQAQNQRRRRAVRAFAKSPYKLAADFAFKALADNDPEVRIEALHSIKALGAQQYIQDVLLTLDDENTQVQKQAVDTLLSLASLNSAESDFQLLVNDFLVALENSEKQACTAIIQALNKLDIQLQQDQLLIIHNCLLSSYPDTVSASATLLAKHQDADSLTLICQRMLDMQLPIPTRIALVQSIGAYEDDSNEVLGALNDALEEKDSAFCQVVMQTLANLQGKATKVVSAYLSGSETNILTEEEQVRQEKLKENQIPVSVSDPDVTAEEPTLEDILATIPEQYPEPLETNQAFSPNSTLASITADNLVAMKSTPKKDTEQSIMEMVDALPEDYDSFAKVVASNFESAGNLNLNRRKIAKAPRFDNQILAARSLGAVANRRSVKLLLDALLGAEPKLQSEIMISLTRIAKVAPDILLLKNAMGPAATMLIAGDAQLRQASAELLGAINHQASIKILLSALQDEDSIVRIKCINALGLLISDTALPATDDDHVVAEDISTELVLNQIENHLEDLEPGVQKAAMQVLAQYQVSSVIDKIIDLGITEEGLNKAAATALSQLAGKEITTQRLTPRVKQLTGMQQAQAITLLGEIFASA